jgi:hypothetical protein
MTPKDILVHAVDPALALLSRLSGIKPDQRARLMLMAIAGQESAWEHRRQIGGPARSFWQFERGGGVAGVLSHPSSKAKIAAVCAELEIPCEVSVVYEAMAWNDVLGASMARLLLYTDPAALPDIGKVEEAWQYYLRNWRPGMPHQKTWAARYGTSMGLVEATAVREMAA